MIAEFFANIWQIQAEQGLTQGVVLSETVI